MLQMWDVIPPDAPARASAAMLARWFGVSKQTIYSWVKKRVLPAPIRLSPRNYFFETSSIRAFVAQRLASNKEGGCGDASKTA